MEEQFVFDFEKNEKLTYLVVWQRVKIISHVRFMYEEDAINFAASLNASAHVYLTSNMELIFANAHSSFYKDKEC